MNGKSNLHSRAVYFHKLATNYSTSPSRSLRILFSLASKVAVSLYEERGGQRKVAQGDFGTITRYFGQPWRSRNKVTKQRKGLFFFLKSILPFSRLIIGKSQVFSARSYMYLHRHTQMCDRVGTMCPPPGPHRVKLG